MMRGEGLRIGRAKRLEPERGQRQMKEEEVVESRNIEENMKV
jgi:hypothetical protein